MKKLLLLFSFIVLFTEAAFATHIMGGEMTYRYLGYNAVNNTYQYRVKIAAYVDAGSSSNFCVGCTRDSITPTGGRISVSLTGRLGDYQNLVVYRNSNRQRLNIIPIVVDTMRVLPNLSVNVEPLCFNGIAVYLDTFVRIIELPIDAKGYIFYYSFGDRNNTLNLGEGVNKGNTFQCIVPNPVNFPNSSPQFMENNFPFMLTNLSTDFNCAATDPDGDRLQYSLVAPYNGGGYGTIYYTPNPYEAPNTMRYISNQYTALQPFGISNGSGAAINDSSGLSSFLVTLPGSYVVTVEISEYRARLGLSDTLLGKTRRELQILVKECSYTGAESKINNSVQVFPNPSSNGVFTISGFEETGIEARIEILSTNSTIVQSSNQIIGRNGSLGIDIHDLCEGVYLTRVLTSKTIFTTHVIKN